MIFQEHLSRTVMDPWDSEANSHVPPESLTCSMIGNRDKGNCRSLKFGRSLSFDDNFVQKEFEKLPDSSQYLSILERKLQRMTARKTPVKKEETSYDLIKGLSALRADRMTEFLSSNQPVGPNGDMVDPSKCGDDYSENDTLYSSWVMQKVFPDRQALSEEELAALLKFDALARLNDRLSLITSSEDVATESTIPSHQEATEKPGDAQEANMNTPASCKS